MAMKGGISIPQTDPGAGYRECRGGIDVAIQQVLEAGHYVLGREVAAFEREFAEYLGVASAIGVASGTDALTIALRACGVGAGDEVLTVSHTAVATIVAIGNCGATPVLIDVEPETFTISAARLAEAVTTKTRAIVPVHLYGQPADLAEILSVAAEYNLSVVEDCAQAHGARYRGRCVGTFGRAAAFSFYPTKNLGAVGDGGCVVTNDAAVAGRARRLREYGWSDRYVSAERGWNSRLDEIQAAILRVKLRDLDAWNEARQTIAAIYDARLAASPVRLPVRAPERTHVFHQYVVRVPERDRVRAELAAAGIGTGIHYPRPVHGQPAYESLAVGACLRQTERLSPEILSLPMYPQLSAGDADWVAAALLRVVGGAAFR